MHVHRLQAKYIHDYTREIRNHSIEITRANH